MIEIDYDEAQRGFATWLAYLEQELPKRTATQRNQRELLSTNARQLNTFAMKVIREKERTR